jgi:hypothetical protein
LYVKTKSTSLNILPVLSTLLLSFQTLKVS